MSRGGLTLQETVEERVSGDVRRLLLDSEADRPCPLQIIRVFTSHQTELKTFYSALDFATL